MMAATIVMTYDSNRSAAIPAQSPTLSPTLSAMVAAFRGSSSGMPASTLPTRSAPTSAALVKIPPPTLMNSAISDAPNPNPTSTAVAVFWKVNTITVAPSRPRPTHNMPVTEPVRNATFRASDIPPPRAAAAVVLTFPRTAMLIPMNPVSPDRVAPSKKHSTRNPPASPKERAIDPSGRTTLVAVKKMSTASGMTTTMIARNCLRRKAWAPSWMALAMSRIFWLPWSARRTPRMSSRPTVIPKSAANENEHQPCLLGAGQDEALVAPFGSEEVGHGPETPFDRAGSTRPLGNVRM